MPITPARNPRPACPDEIPAPTGCANTRRGLLCLSADKVTTILSIVKEVRDKAISNALDCRSPRTDVTVTGQGQTRLMTKKLDLVGVAEIAELLSVSRQRVHQIVREQSEFPEPAAELSAGKVWLRRDVEEWARRDGRLGAGRSKDDGVRRDRRGSRG